MSAYQLVVVENVGNALERSACWVTKGSVFGIGTVKTVPYEINAKFNQLFYFTVSVMPSVEP